MSIFSVILFTKWIAKALFYRIFKTNTDANILSFKIWYSDISADTFFFQPYETWTHFSHVYYL